MGDPKDTYAMGRDCHASGRLTLQHMLLKDQWGLIHPNVTNAWTNTVSEQPRKVADVACGNAIWAIEVAESEIAKDIQVVGFDISTDQFPARENWPSNLTLETWNMFKPPPKQHEGSFDLVNVRLVMITLRDGDPRPVLKNLIKLLKPGGCLQWTEVDITSPALPKNSEDSEYQHVDEVITRAGGPRTFQWIAELGSIFEDAGLQEVEFARRLPRKSMEKFFVDNYVMAVTEMAKGLDSPEVDEWWTKCEKERTEQGVAALWPSVMSVGRKPA